MEENLPSGLYIIATPIGNMGDISLRAIDILKKVDLIACEDTRITGKLTAHYDISTEKISYHDHNAAAMRPKIIEKIRGGARIALVSDAGMPLVSDPGYKLVEACYAAGVAVTCVPGASASLTALALSGLPTDRFFFAGFLPVKSGARKKTLSSLQNIPGSLVFYETAPRLIESLQDMFDILGDRPAAVARELTKKFEEVRRGGLAALVEHYQKEGAPKGEIVIVVGGASDDTKELWTQAEVDRAIETAIENGMSVKDAAEAVSIQSGLKKRDIYARALQLKNDLK